MTANYSIYDSLYLEARAKGWNGWGGNDRIALGQQQLERIFSKPFVPTQGTALELGCGEGHLCRLLSAKGFEVTGVDVSQVAIDWARQKQADSQSIEYIQANFAQPRVLTGRLFDLIVDGNCLHCIVGRERARFLQNAHRLLSKQGIFFISSLCSKSAEVTTTEREGKPYRYIPSAEGLLRELEEAQLDVLHCEVHERQEFNHINVFCQSTRL